MGCLTTCPDGEACIGEGCYAQPGRCLRALERKSVEGVAKLCPDGGTCTRGCPGTFVCDRFLPPPPPGWEPWALGEQRGWQRREGPFVAVLPLELHRREYVWHVIEEPTRARLLTATSSLSLERTAKVIEAALRVISPRRTAEVQAVPGGG